MKTLYNMRLYACPVILRTTPPKTLPERGISNSIILFHVVISGELPGTLKVKITSPETVKLKKKKALHRELTGINSAEVCNAFLMSYSADCM